MTLSASCGFSKSTKALVSPKRGSLDTATNLSRGTTWARTPGGAACSISFLRKSSWATVSDTTIIRLGWVALVQPVATWPCKSRVSIRAKTNLILPSPRTVPSGIAPCGAAGAAWATAGASSGCKASGRTLTPSLAVGIMALAISWALSIEKRLAYDSISIGKLRPATMARVSGASSKRILAWLKGLPPHKSTKNKISSLSIRSTASRNLRCKSSGPSLGIKVTDSTLACSPKIIEPDCLIPSANSPWLAIIIPTMILPPK